MNRTNLIIQELRAHAPFAALGSLAGIALLLDLVRLGVTEESSHGLFAVLHPLHGLLSA